jgi:dephospho-CoA kinase
MRKLFIGITGSIGSGKSTVASIFTNEGIPVLVADIIAKELMTTNKDLIIEIKKQFGEQVYNEGEIDKKVLANIIFNNKTKLDIINSLVHPITINEQLKRAEQLFIQGFNIVASEAALIFESGHTSHFDYIIVVTSDKLERYKRAVKRDNLSMSDIAKRDDNQLPEEYKIQHADFVIKNNGSLNELISNTKFIIQLLKTLPSKKIMDERLKASIENLDIDLISEKLFGLNTNGGEEYCGWVMRTSTDELEWSTDQRDLKMMFICGNEPFDQGPVNPKEQCKKTTQKGIIINTIFCGSYEEGVRTGWKDGADCGNGKYFNIEQNNQILHVDAPQDDEILRLNQELNSTYIAIGRDGISKKERQAMQDNNAGSYGKANATQRAISKSKAAYKNDDWDAVDAYESAPASIEKLAEDDLPSELKGKSKDEIKQYIETQSVKRKEIQVKINDLDTERRKYVAEKQAEMAKTGKNTLDEVMLKTIRDQGTKAGLNFE